MVAVVVVLAAFSFRVVVELEDLYYRIVHYHQQQLNTLVVLLCRVLRGNMTSNLASLAQEVIYGHQYIIIHQIYFLFLQIQLMEEVLVVLATLDLVVEAAPVDM
jgi:hypothetical protein